MVCAHGLVNARSSGEVTRAGASHEAGSSHLGLQRGALLGGQRAVARPVPHPGARDGGRAKAGGAAAQLSGDVPADGGRQLRPGVRHAGAEEREEHHSVYQHSEQVGQRDDDI